MLIESIIRRKAGTKFEVDGKTYDFQSSEKDERHLCDVKDKAAIAKLLSIPEGYCVANAGDEKAAVKAIEETNESAQALTPEGDSDPDDEGINTEDAPVKSTKRSRKK